MRRIYYKTIPSWGTLISVEEWNKWKEDFRGNGDGYWVKNDLVSEAEVFSTPQLDATHVIWFNK